MKRTKLLLNVTGIANDNPLYERIRAAHQILDAGTGVSEAEVKEDWSLGKDATDHPLVILNLSDNFKARAEARFEPAELENPRQLRWRLLDVWDDLLQNRSHILLKRLRQEDDSEDAPNGA